MAKRGRERPCRVDLERMERAAASFDEELRRDAGLQMDYAVEQWWKEGDPVYLKPRREALAKLVAENCEAKTLAWRLMLCDDICIFNGPPYSEPTKTLDKHVEAFRKCRNYCFHDLNFVQFLEEKPEQFEHLISLPFTLEFYSELLVHFARNLGPQAHHYLDISKSLVDAYVKQKTGRYYDEEIAILISGSVRRTYTKEAHRNWRSEYRKRIAAFRKYDGHAQVKFREEKRVLEECAVRVHRDRLYEYFRDPRGTHELLRVNAALAASAGHEGLREGDRITAIDGRPASERPQNQIAKTLQERVWEKQKGLGKTIEVSVWRNSNKEPKSKGTTLHLKL